MSRRLIRIVIGALIAVGVIALLFLVVFPWIDRTFVSDPVLGVGGLGSGSGALRSAP